MTTDKIQDAIDANVLKINDYDYWQCYKFALQVLNYGAKPFPEDELYTKAVSKVEKPFKLLEAVDSLYSEILPEVRKANISLRQLYFKHNPTHKCKKIK